MISGDGLGRRVFAHTEAHEFAAAWSPDGTQLAYIAGEFGHDGSIDLRLFWSAAEGERGFPLAPEIASLARNSPGHQTVAGSRFRQKAQPWASWRSARWRSALSRGSSVQS